MQVSILNSDRRFSVSPDEPILDAALRAGVNLPHSCKAGHCGSCLARLISGKTAYPNGNPLGISAAEIAEGRVLLCQARALTDIVCEVRAMPVVADLTIKRLPCRIERVESWSPDVMGVYLRLPTAEDFSFLPGQYVDVILSGGRRRSFSIASPPQGSRLLELHVRRVAGGEFTERIFAADAGKALLTIEGPLGQFVYRDAGAPMLMIAGGTGLAPLNSIIRHVLGHGLDRRMRLYWGVRSEVDLYAHAALLALAQRAPAFDYIPVLSEGSAQWAGAHGLVHDVVVRSEAALGSYDVYTSGPPAMVDAVRRELMLNGVAEDRLFFDSFDYAPDSVARQLKAARNTS